MNTKPIIFSGPMIQALLAGRKTQARRVCKLPRDYAQIDFVGGRGDVDDPSAWGFEHPDTGHWALQGDGDVKQIPCPYGRPGDLLYVRETFAVNEAGEGQVIYRAEHGECASFHRLNVDESKRITVTRWRPSIYMPRRASRLTLRIADVRVERVQDISDADAAAEGVEQAGGKAAFIQLENAAVYGTCRACFAGLWDSINAKRGYGWDANPWVWALTFEVIHANVDSLLDVKGCAL